jgi:hypothetical protein
MSAFGVRADIFGGKSDFDQPLLIYRELLVAT